MKIQIRRLDDAYHLEAKNENGNTVETDASPDLGGHNKGMRPMEMLASSLGACSAIDVIMLLKKQRQPLEDIRISIDAEREKDKQPALFTDIHLVFSLYGNIDQEKAHRAVQLSMDKYCSVSRILEKTAKITWEVEILPASA
ncbi:MAG: OsmC family protein [Saprospiraceae bacterium]|jgi:putative redox protein